MSTRYAVTEHTMLTLLYAAPASTADLREAPLDGLARFVGQVARNMPDRMLADMERGLARVAREGGPLFDPQRYTLVQARVTALAPLLAARVGGHAGRHPIQDCPDICWSN
ncbi:hypothetical protein [Actinopolyspora mortivallis]|uniref:Uncharacterized protein n=1 Tax=Actinopolyspora mortivallis TaxID=33906 RepID=A0A2T0GRE3_ACTMO|nr:hypothetical protein [Actinopolyspora mortivallis]PRW61678.1 hypothetical protein CEP50_19450 [Actinopolyspora mortivallis]